MGPYLVFLASTVNGYEGTGRALSLKLIQQLRTNRAPAPSSSVISSSGGGGGGGDDQSLQAAVVAAEGGVGGVGSRTLREVSLEEPIRYARGDPIEAWLHEVLCLDASSHTPSISSCPHPSECSLYWVDRDALFSYHSASESFLQRMIALFVASHYKNTPNDLQVREAEAPPRAAGIPPPYVHGSHPSICVRLTPLSACVPPLYVCASHRSYVHAYPRQLMSDAPAHHVFALLGPVDVQSTRLPDVLAVVQVCLEGQISKESARRSLARGEAPSGDLIPWTVAQQFQASDVATPSGARVLQPPSMTFHALPPLPGERVCHPLGGAGRARRGAPGDAAHGLRLARN